MAGESRQGIYQTNWRRGIIGLLVGALAGAVIHIMPRVAIDVAAGQANLSELLGVLPLAFAANFAVWLIPLILIATPVWIILHRLKLRAAWLAAIVGAVLTLFGLAALWFAGTCCTYKQGGLILENVAAVIPAVLMLMVEGAVVGLVIWRCAYRRGAA